MKSKLFLLLALAGSALFAQQAVTVAPNGTGTGTFNTEGITYYVLPAGQTFDLRAGTVYGAIQSALVVTAPLSGVGTSASPLLIPKSTAGVDGYLAAADFATFAAKQPAGSYLTAATGVTTVAGTANEVLVNGGTAATSGAVTLTTPQAIGTGSAVQFAGITDTSTLAVTGTSTLTGTVTVGTGSAGSTHIIVGGGGAGAYDNYLLINGTTGAGHGPYVEWQQNGSLIGDIGSQNNVIGGSTNNVALAAVNSLTFYAGGEAAGNLALTLDTSQNATFVAHVAATQFNTTSSARFKQNFALLDLGSVLDRVQQLRPLSFDLKKGGHSIGFVAEEVFKLFPETVSRDGNGLIEGIDYGKMSTLAIAAIQAQEKEIDHLRLSLLILVTMLAGGVLWIGTRKSP